MLIPWLNRPKGSFSPSSTQSRIRIAILVLALCGISSHTMAYDYSSYGMSAEDSSSSNTSYSESFSSNESMSSYYNPYSAQQYNYAEESSSVEQYNYAEEPSSTEQSIVSRESASLDPSNSSEETSAEEPSTSPEGESSEQQYASAGESSSGGQSAGYAPSGSHSNNTPSTGPNMTMRDIISSGNTTLYQLTCQYESRSNLEDRDEETINYVKVTDEGNGCYSWSFARRPRRWEVRHDLRIVRRIEKSSQIIEDDSSVTYKHSEVDGIPVGDKVKISHSKVILEGSERRGYMEAKSFYELLTFSDGSMEGRYTPIDYDLSRVTPIIAEADTQESIIAPVSDPIITNRSLFIGCNTRTLSEYMNNAYPACEPSTNY